MSIQSIKELQFHITYLLAKTQQTMCHSTYTDQYGFVFDFHLGVYNDTPYAMVKSADGRNQALIQKGDRLADMADKYPVIDEIVRCYNAKPKTDTDILITEITECIAQLSHLTDRLDRMLFAVKGARP